MPVSAPRCWTSSGAVKWRATCACWRRRARWRRGPLEQLGILMILTSDADSEIRETADATLKLLPDDLLAGFIARADVPTELREFFIARGITPVGDAGA